MESLVATPEMRIYEAGPAPTPAELKDGMKLLLDTYGKENISPGGTVSQRLAIGLGDVGDGTVKKILEFRTSFDPNNEDLNRCIGLNMYARTMFPREEGRSLYREIHEIEVHHNEFGELAAVDQKSPYSNKNLTAEERAWVGLLVLLAWEHPTPAIISSEQT